MFGKMIHFDTVQVKFEGQGRTSKFKVTEHIGLQKLSNCWDGRPWLKSRPELEMLNK